MSEQRIGRPPAALTDEQEHQLGLAQAGLADAEIQVAAKRHNLAGAVKRAHVEGASVRQIGLFLGVAKSTVNDLLREEAA